MEGNECNKAIKIVTVLAIIMFIFGASAVLERNGLQKENAQLESRLLSEVNINKGNEKIIELLSTDLNHTDEQPILAYKQGKFIYTWGQKRYSKEFVELMTIIAFTDEAINKYESGAGR